MMVHAIVRLDRFERFSGIVDIFDDYPSAKAFLKAREDKKQSWDRYILVTKELTSSVPRRSLHGVFDEEVPPKPI